MTTLRVDYETMYYGGWVNDHAQKVMKDLGISYASCLPDSMVNCWWFYECENIPDNLPPYVVKWDKKLNRKENYIATHGDKEWRSPNSERPPRE